MHHLLLFFNRSYFEETTPISRGTRAVGAFAPTLSTSLCVFVCPALAPQVSTSLHFSHVNLSSFVTPCFILYRQGVPYKIQDVRVPHRVFGCSLLTPNTYRTVLPTFRHCGNPWQPCERYSTRVSDRGNRGRHHELRFQLRFVS